MALGRLLVRRVLAAATGRPEADLGFEAGQSGKPRLRCGSAEFNLSHAGCRVALAIAPHPVGIDIEDIAALPEPAPSAPLSALDAVLSSAERAMLLGLPPPERARRLVAVWARKEALVKCDGRGLRIDLSAICLLTGQRPAGLQGFCLGGLEVDRAFCLAIAQARGPGLAHLCRLRAFPEVAELTHPGWIAARSTPIQPDATSGRAERPPV